MLRLCHPVDSGATRLPVILTGGIAHRHLDGVVAAATLADMAIPIDEIEMIIGDVAAPHHTGVGLLRDIEQTVAIQDHVRLATGIGMNMIQSEDD